VHIFPGGKASSNITVLDEAKQLGPKYGNFLHHRTLFALVSVKSSKVQGTEAQHVTAMVQATNHIFQSLSKARSTSLGVLNAKALLSGPRVTGLHQNSVIMKHPSSEYLGLVAPKWARGLLPGLSGSCPAYLVCCLFL
jgi:hypothetical protein